MPLRPALKRFVRISDSIDIKKLEHESYRLLYLGFVIAVVFHIALSVFWTYKKPMAVVREPEEDIRKSIPVDIVYLPPSIRNPYETWRKIIRKKIFSREEFKSIFRVA